MATIIDPTLFGNVLNGTDNADVINGNFGNDTISGLLGQDTLSGGQGNDRFVYVGGSGLSEVVPGEIIDGDANTDTIQLDGNLFFICALPISSASRRSAIRA